MNTELRPVDMSAYWLEWHTVAFMCACAAIDASDEPALSDAKTKMKLYRHRIKEALPRLEQLQSEQRLEQRKAQAIMVSKNYKTVLNTLPV